MDKLMEPDFYTKYRPLTSRPFLSGRAYSEYAPCKQLLPYVVCFWESQSGIGDETDQAVRVVPDTCADIIVEEIIINIKE
ncbi:DUF6597 domain-containing transcriptional factor [[Clostridium] scindens]|uniref:DUF6597 domain-containing transcriptional factor n=2 Tax=Clostridium scindens (strain JCM 10418 / VPI 12708) TaxID=29347 RepID=UPI003AB42704